MQKGFSKILIIVIVGAVIVAGGILVWQQSQASKEETEEPVVEAEAPVAGEEEVPAPEEEPADETADWEIYRNEKLGYSIKYPQDWFVEEATILITDIRPFQRKQNEYSDPFRDLEIRVLDKEHQPSYYACLFGSDGNWTGNESCGYSRLGNYNNLGEFLIGGMKAYAIQTLPSTDAKEKGFKGFNIVFLRKGDVVYEMTFYSGHNQMEIVNKILSTFRFID